MLRWLLRKTDMDVLREVNRKVNRAIRYKSVPNDVGISSWNYYPPEGDCADYTFTKLCELIKRKWDMKRLKPIVGILKGGEGHAALLVDGKWQLDNRWDEVREVKESGWRTYVQAKGWGA